jgi:hypothetical protein
VDLDSESQCSDESPGKGRSAVDLQRYDRLVAIMAAMAVALLAEIQA